MSTPLTGHFGDDFISHYYGSYDPTNTVIALKDDGQSTRSRANPIRLSSTIQ